MRVGVAVVVAVLVGVKVEVGVGLNVGVGVGVAVGIGVTGVGVGVGRGVGVGARVGVGVGEGVGVARKAAIALVVYPKLSAKVTRAIVSLTSLSSLIDCSVKRTIVLLRFGSSRAAKRLLACVSSRLWVNVTAMRRKYTSLSCRVKSTGLTGRG